jgi:hypothetical protein
MRSRVPSSRPIAWYGIVWGACALSVTGCAAGKPIEGSLASFGDVVALSLVPASVIVTQRGSADFQATVQLSDGSQTPATGASFEATGGTVDAGGHYIAGATTGNFRVIASLGGKADTSLVEITLSSGPALTAVSVTPASAALVPGATQQFSATGVLSDGSDSAIPITWGATGGTISPTGLFTAPGLTGNYLVVATQQGGTLSDTAQVTVTVVPPTLAAVVLTPATASLQFGKTQQFAAVGRLNDGTTTSIAVTWSATGGTVNSSGLYTAGNTAGTFRVIARAANGLADTSAITITAATIVSVSLTPATVSLQTGQTQQFSVSATLSSGGTQNNPAVTYSVTGGTITTGGLYTAGGTAGSFRVIATATGGAADTSAVSITVATITAITVTPATPTVTTGQTQQFSASATLSNGGTQANPSVTWSATGGTISTGGLYTAGTTAGSFRVIAVQQGGTLADTSVGTITAPGAFNPYANRPANYTVVQSDYAFSTGIPVSINAPVADGSGWIANYNTDGWMYRGTDATAPISPPNVLEWSYVAGQGTPTSSAGFGHLYLPVDPAIKSWYASFAIWHDANFEWNAVGNKLFEWFTYNQNGVGVAILNSRNGPGDFMSWILENVPTTTLYSRTTAFGNSLSDAYFDGHWVNVELQYKSSTPGNNDGELRVWVARSDGSDGPVGKLTLQYTGLQLPGAVGQSELNLNSTWGGGSGPTTRNSIRRIDHILLAHP